VQTGREPGMFLKSPLQGRRRPPIYVLAQLLHLLRTSTSRASCAAIITVYPLRFVSSSMSQTIPQETSDSTRIPSAQRELETLLTTVGVAALAATGWIEIRGADRVRWLNGMVTNSVQGLAVNAGCYNFILNAQGRIQGDGYIFAQADHLLLQTGLSHVPNTIALLDRFIIMDDVELSDANAKSRGLLLAGPHASELLGSLDLLPLAGGVPGLAHLSWRGMHLTVVRAYGPLVPRFEIWSDETSIGELSAEIVARNVTQCSPLALELLRICEGTPLFGVDIRDRDLPQETGATRALHFAKGCYLGQEIVERIRSRGNVHRTFHGFHLGGGRPSPGMALSVEGKPVGELTSVATVPGASGDGELQIGLGYIRREVLAGSKSIQYEGGVARPAALPFDRAKIL